MRPETAELLAGAALDDALDDLDDDAAAAELMALPAETIAADDVRPGDRLLVRAGATVPVDAEVVSGRSSLDNAHVTGESRPCAVARGGAALAGATNIGAGALVVRAGASAADSTLSRLVELVEEAQAQRSPTERVVESFAKVYTPIVLSAAVLLATVPWAVAPAYGATWTYRALVLLVVACPCALVISTPVTYMCSLSAAAAGGVLVKGGTHLETLAALGAVGVDKTGTLTRGEFGVRGVAAVLADGAPPRARGADAAAASAASSSSAATHRYAARRRGRHAKPKTIPGTRLAPEGAEVEGA